MKGVIATGLLGLAVAQQNLNRHQGWPAQFGMINQDANIENFDNFQNQEDSDDILLPPEDMMPGKQNFNPFPNGPYLQEQDPQKNNRIRSHENTRPFHPYGPQPPTDISVEDWERHISSKHSKRKHHFFGCILFALFFIILGVLIGKCVKKCRKNRKRQCKQWKIKTRNASKVMNEIEKHEKILNELKSEYERKRINEHRQISQYQNDGFRHPHGQQAQQQPQVRGFGYYQHYPQHPQQVQQHPLYEQIPIGRPINQSNNSSFATEYPQL